MNSKHGSRLSAGDNVPAEVPSTFTVGSAGSASFPRYVVLLFLRANTVWINEFPVKLRFDFVPREI